MDRPPSNNHNNHGAAWMGSPSRSSARRTPTTSGIHVPNPNITPAAALEYLLSLQQQQQSSTTSSIVVKTLLDQLTATVNKNNNNTNWQGPNNHTTDGIPDDSKAAEHQEEIACIPCRARGMPLTHNFKTANFVIPNDIQHGDRLVCSYPECRDGGVKFRWCEACKSPVAKRSFHTRHNHGLLDNGGGRRTASKKQSSAKKTKTPPPKNHQQQEEKGPPIAAASLSSSSNSKAVSFHTASVPAAKQNKKILPMHHHHSPSSSSLKRPASLSSASSSSSKRQKRVAAQALTQLSTTASASSVSNTTNNNNNTLVVLDSRRMLWERLLDERPKMEETSKITDWLTRVLATSDPHPPPPRALPVGESNGSSISESTGAAHPSRKPEEETSSNSSGTEEVSSE